MQEPEAAGLEGVEGVIVWPLGMVRRLGGLNGVHRLALKRHLTLPLRHVERVDELRITLNGLVVRMRLIGQRTHKNGIRLQLELEHGGVVHPTRRGHDIGFVGVHCDRGAVVLCHKKSRQPVPLKMH